MTNPWFDHTPLSEGKTAYAADINAIANAIQSAFDKLVSSDRIAKHTYLWGADTSTTPNSVTIAISWPSAAGVNGYHDGMVVFFEAANTNTGPCSISVGGLPYVGLANARGEALIANELLKGQTYGAVYVSGAFRLFGLAVSGASTSTLAPNALGEIPPLKYDGTDETVSLERWLKKRIVDDKVRFLRVLSPEGKSARINGPVSIRRRNISDPVVLDMSSFRIDAGKQFRIRFNGRSSEFPQTNQYLLAADAAANATTISVDTSPQNGDHSRLSVGAKIIIRGQNDKYGQVLPNQKHETTITAKNVVSSTQVDLTIADPLPDAFKVSYPNSEWVEEDGTADKTYIAVSDEISLSSDHSNTDTFTLSSDPAAFGWSAGDWVIIQDDTKASDIQGSSSQLIRRRLARILSIDSSTNKITVDRVVPDSFLTSRNARATRIEPVASIIFMVPQVVYVEASDPPPATRHPTFECRYGYDVVYMNGRINDVAQGLAHRGQLLRMEFVAGATIVGFSRTGMLTDFTNYGSGDGYGLYFVSCRDISVRNCFMQRVRHGVVFMNCWDSTVTDSMFVDCLINGCDTHGGDSKNISFSKCFFVAGKSRPPDAVNQSGVTIGNTTHQAGDYDVTIDTCVFRGFKDTDGAVEIRTPCGNVLVSNATVIDGVDGVTLKSTGGLDGGPVLVSDIRMVRSTGYAVDDDTSSGPTFSKLRMGPVFDDGNAAGPIQSGAVSDVAKITVEEAPSDNKEYVRINTAWQAVAPKGSVTDRFISVSADYTLSTSDRVLIRSGYDTVTQVLWVLHSTPSNALTITVPNNLPKGAAFRMFVDSAQAGTVTIQAAAGAQVVGATGDPNSATVVSAARLREVLMEVIDNADGQSAVLFVRGDVAKGEVVFDDLTDLRIDGNLQLYTLKTHRRLEQEYTTSQTFGAGARGLVLRFRGLTAAVDATFDTSSGQFDAGSRAVVENADGTYAVNIKKSGGTGSVAVNPGKARVVACVNEGGTVRLKVSDEYGMSEVT